MNLLNYQNTLLPLFFLLFSTQICLSQQGSLTINEDPEVTELLDLKKKMNFSETDSERYKIQIYSGNRPGAEKAETQINSKLNNLPSILVFETPNYKVWVGNFRSRLEADRTLLKVQKEFKNAFVFKPKKEKE
jgi:hypothetical protein